MNKGIKFIIAKRRKMSSLYFFHYPIKAQNKTAAKQITKIFKTVIQLPAMTSKKVHQLQRNLRRSLLQEKVQKIRRTFDTLPQI